jgi:hypothetical protein
MPIAGKNCSALEWLTLLIVYIVHQGVVIALGERCKNTSNLESFPLFETFLLFSQYHELWRVLHIGVVTRQNDFGHLLSRGGAGEGRKGSPPSASLLR